MDLLTIIGVIVAFAALIGGNYLEGGAWHLLLNGPAALIVLGGTIGAAIVQTPKERLGRAFVLVKWAFAPPQLHEKKSIKTVIQWSNLARKRGLLGLEQFIHGEPDILVRKGLQMLVDGENAGKIRLILEQDIELRRQRDSQAALFFESMGGYAPTIGIIGAVIGLIHVMGHIGSPTELGPALAIAFVATLYGVGFANLLCLPIANKLHAQIDRYATWQCLMVDGLTAIADGENPKNIEATLQGYLGN